MEPADLVAIGLLLFGAYLVGSVPMGYLAGRLKGIDLRTVGSGNIGASNVTRTLGRGFGLAVFAFDFLKGFVPAFVAMQLGRRDAVALGADEAGLLTGIAAFLGHVFPVWLGFKGGKGVATAAGMCCALAPLATVIALAVWVAVFRASRYVSLASMAGAVAFPLAFVLSNGGDAAFGERKIVTGVAVLLAVAIIVLHRANIRRLLRGEELRMGGKAP